jgi:hypothetical protein
LSKPWLIQNQGPPTNLALQNVIVEMTPNNGKYSWTPSADIEPSDSSAPAKGYGIQLIVDNGAEKGQYQYTTQFGISNPNYNGGSSSGSSSASSRSAPAYVPSSKDEASSVPANYSVPAASTTKAANATTLSTAVVAPTATAANTSLPAPYYPVSTMPVSAGAASPTGAVSRPPTGNSTGVEVSTGGAANLATGALSLVCAAGVAVFAF